MHGSPIVLGGFAKRNELSISVGRDQNVSPFHVSSERLMFSRLLASEAFVAFHGEGGEVGHPSIRLESGWVQDEFWLDPARH